MINCKCKEETPYSKWGGGVVEGRGQSNAKVFIWNSTEVEIITKGRQGILLLKMYSGYETSFAKPCRRQDTLFSRSQN